MNKHPKQCPHTNTIQAGNPGIIETFCADCNELIKTVYFGIPYGTVDSHGDVIMHGACAITENKFKLLNHKK